MSKETLVIDLGTIRVDYPSGVQTVIFTTTSGEEVHFQRNRQDYVVKTTPVQVEGANLAQARIEAGKMLSKFVLERGGRTETKVVPPQFRGQSPASASAGVIRPAWLSEQATLKHALASDPRERDD
jgi:hypothetical protein